jgi:hypothetical protein
MNAQKESLILAESYQEELRKVKRRRPRDKKKTAIQRLKARKQRAAHK